MALGRPPFSGAFGLQPRLLDLDLVLAASSAPVSDLALPREPLALPRVLVPLPLVAAAGGAGTSVRSGDWASSGS